MQTLDRIGAPFRIFNTQSVAKFQNTQPKNSRKTKIEKKFSIFFQKLYPVNRIVPKTLGKGPFGFFLKSILLRTIKKIEGGPFGNFKKFSKNLTKPKLHLNFENVVFELLKRYIRTLKTLYANFKNVTLNFNFENILSELKFLQTTQLIKLIKSVKSVTFCRSLKKQVL